MRRLTLFLAGLLLGGCGPRTGTRLDPIAAQTAVVGVELEVMLRAATPAAVDFRFATDVDLEGRHVQPTLTPYANGEALFRWTPLASDVGDHHFTFSATVDGLPASQRVAVRVIAGADPITFREPVGEGTTLDLARAACVVVPLLVDDTSSTEVQLAAGNAWSDGATLERDGPLSGRLRFCPPTAQTAAHSIFPLSVVATDAGGARAEKRYTVVLGTLPAPVVVPMPGPSPTPGPSPSPSSGCDTLGPTIQHSPHGAITTAGNPHLYATLADLDGIYDGNVYWSTTPPLDPVNPDLSTMNVVAMQLLSGSLSSGDWGATIPSPVASAAPGTSATLYYVIVATDADDARSGCAFHTTVSPTSGVYSFVIKRAR